MSEVSSTLRGLLKEDIIKLHDEMINLYGGVRGILYNATIDFALEKARNRSDIVEQASTLLEIIASEHPFVDGNKRTAFASAELLLSLNGHFIEIKDDEKAIKFLMKVARKELDHKDISLWIRSRLKSLK